MYIICISICACEFVFVVYVCMYESMSWCALYRDTWTGIRQHMTRQFLDTNSSLDSGITLKVQIVLILNY